MVYKLTKKCTQMTLGILKYKTIISSALMWYAKYHDVKKTSLKIKLFILTKSTKLANSICVTLRPLGI